MKLLVRVLAFVVASALPFTQAHGSIVAGGADQAGGSYSTWRRCRHSRHARSQRSFRTPSVCPSSSTTSRAEAP